MSDRQAATAAARALVLNSRRATLATHLAEGGAPYASLVLVAPAADGSPILLISTLAQHTRNIAADSRVSLLYDGTLALDDPLTGPRLTVLGTAQPSDDPALEAAYLACHPQAAEYAGFGDFGYYRITVARAHFVAGFGEIRWIEGDILTGGG